jgi:hypothetical protein
MKMVRHSHVNQEEKKEEKFATLSPTRIEVTDFNNTGSQILGA